MAVRKTVHSEPSTVNNKSKGFTLIELLVVITMIGLLSFLTFTSFVNSRMKAKDSRRKSDLAQIETAIEHLRADTDNRSVPQCTAVDSNNYCLLNVTNLPGLTSSYIPTIPTDPKTSANYWYKAYQSDVAQTPCGAGSGTNCFTYRLVACLENTKDPKQDPSTDVNCSGSASYTVYSPSIN